MANEKIEGATPRRNVPELSVSELAFSLKKTLEDTYGHVRVRGELSRVKIHTSGHLYSDLKDQDAVINLICWKGTLGKLAVRPEEGLEVICTGRISTYPARSNYQLIVEAMELAGEGALLKMLEDRRKKLAAEGLFDAARKRRLPFLPNRIGVITSATGAVIRDIMHRLDDRFPRHVMLWPVAVQGPGAAEQIAAGIEGFNKLSPDMWPDLLIVARGGGSLEDLMAFNEEIVVRAAAASTIPLISAVGHETDTTLIDFAADVRAPTPTGAAEIAVPRRLDLMARIAEDAVRLGGGADRTLSRLRERTRLTASRLRDPVRILENKAQQLDHVIHRLSARFGQLLSRRRESLAALGAQIRHPRLLLAEKHRQTIYNSRRLDQLGDQLLTRFARDLDTNARMLESLSFKNILRRGFAVIRDTDNRPLTAAGQIRMRQDIQLEFSDGRRFATAGDPAPSDDQSTA